MDKRVKYSLKEKLAIVISISRGQQSRRSAAKQLGTNPITVSRWVNLYKHHGKPGLELRYGSYGGPFKVEVILYMLKNHLSLVQTAAHFGIPQDYTVGRWFNTYKSHGTAGLLKETRGRKSISMSKKGAKKIKLSPTDPATRKFASLEEEVEYLRAENAFLKKLDALIQEEEAARILGKQQKPSRN